MTTLFKKGILFVMMTAVISNLETHAQSTTISNDYAPTSFLGWGSTSGDLLFKVNNDTKILLQNNTGNLGIGTILPTSRLHVVNTISTTPVASFQTSTGFNSLVVKADGKIAVGSPNGSGSQFDVRAQGLPNTFENLFNFTVTDAVEAGNVRDYVAITNATNADGQFAPLVASCYGSGASAPNLNFRAQTPVTNDLGNVAMSRFDAYLLNTTALVANRPLVQFTNRGNIRVNISANGSIYAGSLPNSSFNVVPAAQLHVVGSGTTSATYAAKFQNYNSTDIFTIRNDNKIIYTDGTQGAGRVLTSDANGVASWQPNSSSQWITNGNTIYYDLGKIGIGTSTPDTTLHIAGSVKIVDGTQGAGRVLTSDANGVASWQAAGISSQWGTNGSNIYYNSGKIGVGTSTPDTTFHVAGAIKIVDGTEGAGRVLTSDANGLARWQPNSSSQWTTIGSDIYYSTGKVLVGNPNLAGFQGMPGTYQLYVQGGILSEKVKVAVATSSDWSDYVFAKDYKLKSLKEVETFIQTNKHLPNIPSAQEVVKEGIDMAKMDAKLLEKIEELTLYMIEQDKKNTEQEKMIKELSSMNEKLIQQMKALQNK